MLIGLAGLIGALLALAVAGALGPARRRGLVPLGCAGLAGGGLVLALLALARGGVEVLVLPIGLPGLGMRLALDPLAAFFLLPVCVSGVAVCVWSGGGRVTRGRGVEGRERAGALVPLLLAAMLLAVLAGDGWSLVFGVELMVACCWALIAARPDQAEVAPAAAMCLAVGLLAGACLVPGFALLGGTGAGFDALRAAAPPEGARAAAVLGLVLVGAGGQAGLAPLHLWLPRVLAVAPGGLAALMAAAMVSVGLYVLVRVLFDLCGPQPVWWCLPLLAMAAGSALIGALGSALAAGLAEVLAAATVGQAGLIGVGLAVALAARGSDLGPLAGLALSAALLHVLVHALFATCLFLAAGSAAAAAGSRRLAGLGGLAVRMPVVTGCVLVAGASWAGLPPSAGFASRWLLAQALLAAPRVGGLGMQILFAAALVVLGLSAALAALAAVRLIGVGFLGRPRTARGSAAAEPAARARGALIGLCLVLALLGALPGLGMRLLAPIPPMLIGAGAEVAGGVARLAPAGGAPGYAALLVSLALGVAAAALWWRARAVEVRRAPAWDGGFAAPPPWLPFGDPATQIDARSFSRPLGPLLGGGRAGRLVAVAGGRMRGWVERGWVERDWQERLPGGVLALLVGALLVLLVLFAARGNGLGGGP